MRRILGLAALSLALQTSALAAAPASSAFSTSRENAKQEDDCGTRPAWCQAGFVCLPRACAEEAAVELRLLTAETEALRKHKARRWNCTLGPGAGVYVQVEKDEIGFDAAPLVGAIVCGWTF